MAFYIAADRIMNGYPARKSLISMIKETYVVGGGKILIIKYLYHLRKYAYYYNTHKKLLSWNSMMMAYEHYKVAKLSIKTGIDLGCNTFGYGLVIPHHGTIIASANAQVGNYAVLHTCTCIAGGDKLVGDGFYFSTGSQLVGSLELGDHISVCAHSLVNKSFSDNKLIAGTPATIKKNNIEAWWIRDGEEYTRRHDFVEHLKQKIFK